MSTRKPIAFNSSEGVSEEISTTDDVELGKITLNGVSGVAVDAGGQRVVDVATPSAGTDAANKDYVDSAAGGGLNPDLSNLAVPTAANASIIPNAQFTYQIGNYGKSWLGVFTNTVASSDTDLYVITTPGTFGNQPLGRNIFVKPDVYGINPNVNGGNITLETISTTGTGNSGSVTVKTGNTVSGTRGDLTVDVNEANVVLDGPLNVNGSTGLAGQALTSQGAALPPAWASVVTTVNASAPLSSSGGATPNISLSGVVGVSNGGTGLSSLTTAGNVLVAQTAASLASVPVSGDASIATTGAVTVTGLQTNPVSASAPTAGQFLGWTGAAWAPADVTGGGGGFGPGLVFYLEFGTPATSPPPSFATAKLMDFSYSTDPQSNTGAISVPNSTSQQVLATFMSDPGTPGDATIPAGLWDLAFYCESSGASSETSFRFLVQIWDGTTATTVATSDDVYITGAANVMQQYTASVFVPLTDLTSSDRVIIVVEGRRWVASSHTITGYFQGATISHVHTTLTAPGGTGIVKVLNGVIQTPASLIVDADVSVTAAIAQSKIANLTTDLASKVSSVSASAPLASSGGTTPTISITAGSSVGDVLAWDGSVWSATAPAAAGANTTLSNLVSPTSINQDLIPSSNLRSIGEIFTPWLNAYVANVRNPSGDLFLATGETGGPAPASPLNVYVASANAGLPNVATGVIDLSTGQATGTGNSGAISLTTGTTVSGTRGDVSVNSRQLNLALDSALTVNTAAGTSGQVLTSQGTGSPPIWTTPSSAGANTSLSNLVAPTAVNEHLIPGTSTLDLGTTSAPWRAVYSADLRNPTGNLTVAAGPAAVPVASPLSVSILTPGSTTNVNTGAINLTTANALGTGNSGAIALTTGSIVSGTRGNVSIDSRQLNLTLSSALTVNASAGTSGQVLTSQGSSAAPTWTTVSGGANTSLSNLVGPTSVNTSLIPSTSGLDLGTAASKWDDIFVSNVRNPSGDLVLATGPAAIPVAAPYDIFILTAGPNANVDSGDITIATAAATGTGNSGTLTIQTGTTVSGTRGNVAVNTRQLALTMTGALSVNASTGTSGQVLTSQGAGAAPIWAASSGSVTGVTASAPLASSGGATPDISLTYGASGAGGAAFGGYTAKTANYTAGATDYVINCTANSFAVTLPTAVGVTGRMYTVKNSASGTTITVNTTSAQTIDGAASVSISTQYASITVMSTGANWIII